MATRLQTDRLVLQALTQHDENLDPEEFLSVYNTNPDWIDASTQFTGTTAYTLNDVEMALWEETTRENSRCFAIRLQENGEIIGVATLIASHPKGDFAALGLIILRREYQRRGFGSEALAAIENSLASEGWKVIEAAVMKATPVARAFFERYGYATVRAGS
jgi:RimJ/RimL family protein N-acetyltransferase